MWIALKASWTATCAFFCMAILLHSTGAFDFGAGRPAGDLKAIKCLANCKACRTSTICDQCDPGFFLAPDHRQCVHCSTGCRECTSPTSCTRCFARYFLKDGTCEPCVDYRCLDCEPTDVCKRCSRGYTVNSINRCMRDHSGNLTLITIIGLFFACISCAILLKFFEPPTDEDSSSAEEIEDRHRYSNILHHIDFDGKSLTPDHSMRRIGLKDTVYRKQADLMKSREESRLKYSAKPIKEVSNSDSQSLSSVTGKSESGKLISSTDRIKNPDDSSIVSFLGSDTNPFENPPILPNKILE